jgi:hypothetical protein
VEVLERRQRVGLVRAAVGDRDLVSRGEEVRDAGLPDRSRAADEEHPHGLGA